MEGLSAFRFGALLIQALDGSPAGVVSRTDLIRAYKHGIVSRDQGREIMTFRCRLLTARPLGVALKTMIFSDIHRLFDYQDSPQKPGGGSVAVGRGPVPLGTAGLAGEPDYLVKGWALSQAEAITEGGRHGAFSPYRSWLREALGEFEVITVSLR